MEPCGDSLRKAPSPRRHWGKSSFRVRGGGRGGRSLRELVRTVLLSRKTQMAAPLPRLPSRTAGSQPLCVGPVSPKTHTEAITKFKSSLRRMQKMKTKTF